MIYVRYFATTDDSPTGVIALEYLRSIMKFAPVRVLSVSGGLSGQWEAYAQLLATPLTYPFVNVVCCDPARWCWTQQVAMPRKDRTLETTEGTFELYTDGIRNVLVATALPAEGCQQHTAARYEAIVVPAERLAIAWPVRVPIVIPVPVSDDGHAILRFTLLD